jgi:hypothetical protein
MEWEPVFILGVTGGAMLISAVRNVIDTGRRVRPVQSRRAAPERRETARDIGDLNDRVAVLEWLATPAARSAAENERLRRGAA